MTPARGARAAITSVVALAALALVAAQRGDTAPQTGVDLIGGVELPRTAQDARGAGMTEADLAETLRLLQAHGVSPADARAVLVAYLRLGMPARGETLAPVVRGRLEAGVRGAALADAIRSVAPSQPAGAGQPPSGTLRLPPPPDSVGERRPMRDTIQLRPPASPPGASR
ncbi:MAG TPA: hypothetical protein VMM18_00805 [Gemmatimonadaceae bacterium]|nr:hypothetical protein [Gemmatimonadaceae bacterium]